MSIYFEWFLGELHEKIDYEDYDSSNKNHFEKLKNMMIDWGNLFKKVMTEENDEIYYICVLEKVFENKNDEIIDSFKDIIKISIEESIIKSKSYESWKSLDIYDVGYPSKRSEDFIFIEESHHSKMIDLVQDM